MILTLDIGNSNIVSVLYDNEGKIIKDDRRLTVREANYEKYKKIFKDLVVDMDLNINLLQSVVISCVVPYITSVIMDVLKEIFPKSKIIELSLDKVAEMVIKLNEPRELGQDIIATSVGAYSKYKGTTIVADLGSATKLSIINDKKEFLGGLILPGIEFQARSLNQMIPHLPLIDVVKPKSVIGNGTSECIQSGIIYGSLAAIIELANEIEDELGIKCNRVITGGLSKLFTKEELEGYTYDEFLLSDGLYYIGKKEGMNDEDK